MSKANTTAANLKTKVSSSRTRNLSLASVKTKNVSADQDAKIIPDWAREEYAKVCKEFDLYFGFLNGKKDDSMILVPAEQLLRES